MLGEEKPGMSYRRRFLALAAGAMTGWRPLAAQAALTVPLVSAVGADESVQAAPHPAPTACAGKSVGKYSHRNIAGGIGHNLPQEAPEAFAQAIVDVSTS